VDDERFCTVILGILTVTDEIVLDLASGGHPYPIKRQRDGNMLTISLGGSLLGQLDDIEVAHRRVPLAAGEEILLFTDGVIESRADGVFFDTAGIRAVLGEAHPSAEAIVRSLGEKVVAFSGGRLDDDVAAMALRIDDGLGVPARSATGDLSREWARVGAGPYVSGRHVDG
jgi:serine phosphatase RsbU (regulator of sigma subunit)